MSQSPVSQLQKFILSHYNLDEFKTLCIDLMVHYDDLGGEARAGKARELVLYLQRHERLVDLQAVLAQQHKTAYQAVFGEEAARPVVGVPSTRSERRRGTRNPKQIFLSHATVDAIFAHKLADDLRREGYDIWIAPESIIDGQWVSAINKGLAESSIMLLVLTPAVMESPWVEMETNVAIELERMGEMRFIPICLENGRYELIWHSYQWIMFDNDYSAAFKELINKLQNRVTLVKSGNNQANSLSTTSPPASDNKIQVRLTSETTGNTVQARIPASALFYQLIPALVTKLQLPSDKLYVLMDYESGHVFRETDSLASAGIVDGQHLILMRHEFRALGVLAQHLKLDFLHIPRGLSVYGASDDDQLAYADEKPQQISFLDDYWISRTPVTNAQFSIFVHMTGYQTIAERKGEGFAWKNGLWQWVKGANWYHPNGPNSSIEGLDDHPVVQVTWDDAQAFCEWMGVRLPTEQEWEKAARGIDGRSWPWGNEIPTSDYSNFNYRFERTTPVGFYSPKGDSAYGCVDMAGNVQEWTSSWYHQGSARILRGGSWSDEVRDIRVTCRNYSNPFVRFSNVGFRVVKRNLWHPSE